MLVYLNLDPRFDRIHSDPRFKMLINRVGSERPVLPTPARETAARRPAIQGNAETDGIAGMN